MALLGPSRRDRGGPDPHLDTKISLFLGGAALAVAGMATGTPLLIWLAFLPLALAFVVRFIRRQP